MEKLSPKSQSHEVAGHEFKFLEFSAILFFNHCKLRYLLMTLLDSQKL